MPSKPALKNGQSCLQSRSARWGGGKGRKSISRRNWKPIAHLRETGHNEHLHEGHLPGGIALLTERSKAGLVLSVWPRGLTMLVT